MSLTGSSNEEKIWNFLKNKINNNYGVAGLMGNLYAESGLNPQNLQNSYETKLGYTDATYTAAVDNGTYTNFVKDSAGYGLAQWTYYSRKQNLLDYIQEQKLSIGDLEGQLNFLYKELSSSYSSILTTLKSATTVLAASNAVLTGYEKPADQSTSVQTKRASYGQTYYDKYATTTTTSSNTGGTTMGYSRSVIVAQAQAWLGYNESDGTHKQIIDVYNAHTPLARSYKVQYTDAWCATFVSAVSIKCGYTAIIPTECSCIQMITLFKNLGEWKEDDSYTPSAGDIIFYDWQDTTGSSSDNTGQPDHVGIVESVSGTTITVIEGNYDDQVKRRTMQVNGKYIRGYGLPAYTSAGTSSTASSTSTSATTTTSASSSSSSSALNKTEKWSGKVTASSLNIRTYAGSSNATVSFSPLKKDTVVSVCDEVTASDKSVWYYIKYNGKYGFASAKYITENTATTSTTSTSTSSSTTSSVIATEKAASYDKSLAGTYTTTAKLNVRNGAGTGKKVLVTIPKGTSVTSYGYYSTVSGLKWMYVTFTYNKVQYTGFCSKTYLK